jgi:Protein of unknown function (DUF1403)
VTPRPELSPFLRPPAWALTPPASSTPQNRALAAAFGAGAALAALDFVVRRNAAWAGLWRRRLALKAASLSGGREDEAALRDALAYTAPGGDPGPAGRIYAAWRALTLASPRHAAALAAPLSRLAADELAAIVEAQLRAQAPAPLAAAAAAQAVLGRQADAQALAFAIADIVLAARLGWREVVPLLAPAFSPARPAGDADFAAACCAAYVRAAATACDLDAELAQAAARLLAAAPRLRAKGAKAAISALLEEDALTGAAAIPGLSDRGLRRLFDRLVALGAARELSGRPTFRLYGL